MSSHILDWLNLLARWAHIVAGIAWIGSSFFFMWLDKNLSSSVNPKTFGELWMVHSGGFYQVEKREISSQEMPKVLHWFKWEAFFTWLSGVFLLIVVYYLTNGIYLIDPAVSSISIKQATGIGIAVLLLSWFLYDFVWASKLIQFKKMLSFISLLFIAFITYSLGHLLSGRAAFIHVGVLLGTLMVGNVWFRILPAQQQMIQATKDGKLVDFTLGSRAKVRSVHNNYMTFPLLFIMFSNHFPMVYSHSYNWLVLTLLMLSSAGVKHVMNSWTKSSGWILVFSFGILALVIYFTYPKNNANPIQHKVTFSQAYAVIEKRCFSCHSSHPTDDVFKSAPNGVVLDAPQKIQAFAQRIRERVFIHKTMPLANKTGMTDKERDLINQWILQGASTNL